MLSNEWFRMHNLHYDEESNLLYGDTPLTSPVEKELHMLLGVVPKLKIIDPAILKAKFEANNEPVYSGPFEWIEAGKSAPENEEKKSLGRDTIDYVNHIVTEAIDSGTSDLHVEPFAEEVQIRYRLHGILHVNDTYNPEHHRAVIARLKIMSGLDIAETRRPLDGNIRVTRGSRQVDIRLSTMPTRFGEKAVLRLLDKSRLKLDLKTLGFTQGQLSRIRETMALPNGLILCTGPTGSGKTTTLYSILTELNQPQVNILTIEDPIEYELKGINQSQVNTAINLSFASALRAFLRQDPDIIMVGEIRDKETTEIVLRAAMTGHLVLSTLHTNRPEEARQRLLDLGGSPYLIDDTIKLVIGQTLVPVYKNKKIVGRTVKAKII